MSRRSDVSFVVCEIESNRFAHPIRKACTKEYNKSIVIRSTLNMNLFFNFVPKKLVNTNKILCNGKHLLTNSEASQSRG